VASHSEILRTSMQLTPLHSAEELRQISNLAHGIEGIVLGLAALIAIVQATGRLNTGRARYLWPALILLAGAGLLFYLVVPHHGLARARAQWEFVFGDPQQRQHLVIAALIILAGLAEVLARSGRLEAHVGSLVWPAVLLIVGVLFVIHQQHGTSAAVMRAMLVHRWLGSLLVAAGALAGIDAMRSRRGGAMTAGWAVMLLLASLLLIVYREPEGAYHGAMPTRGSGPTRAQVSNDELHEMR